VKHQQHFLRDTTAYAELLGRLPLAGRTVIDLGMGHGEMTRLVLAAGAEKVVGVEIDPRLPNVDDPRVEVIIGDFTRMAVERQLPYGAAVVSNPPYDLLPEVFGLIRRRQASGIVLMVPERYGVFPGYKAAFSLGGDAFVPESKGQHLVLVRGWGSNGETAA